MSLGHVCSVIITSLLKYTFILIEKYNDVNNSMNQCCENASVRKYSPSVIKVNCNCNLITPALAPVSDCQPPLVGLCLKQNTAYKKSECHAASILLSY